ncbi:hypothetical protein HNQ59_000488 [Chitinivorax tropicus]|uniref:Uncharacterized protein n=1 Tax=Chitinivorax tropicus TaxID=714531 RepID=A0A840MKZ1_9PROT|nr:hypothetical protein [Chitinivorax tropicus]
MMYPPQSSLAGVEALFAFTTATYHLGAFPCAESCDDKVDAVQHP